MTEQKAEEILQELYDECCTSRCKFKGKCKENCYVAVNTAITDMREIQRYRALGTAEELREARKKQVPKKPIDCVEKYLTGRKNYFYCCSCCDGVVDDTFDKYCRFCGQKLDWSDENEQ